LCKGFPICKPDPNEIAEFRAALGINDGAPIVGGIMRFVRAKDPELLPSLWARKNLVDVALSTLNVADGRLAALFGPEAIKNFIAANHPSERVSFSRLWTIAVLESWLRHHSAII
jgi:hypothetical protein